VIHTLPFRPSGFLSSSAGDDTYAVGGGGHPFVAEQAGQPCYFGTVDIGAVEFQCDRIIASGLE